MHKNSRVKSDNDLISVSLGMKLAAPPQIYIAAKLPPQPWTLNPEPWTLNPEPWTLNLEPWTFLLLSLYNVWYNSIASYVYRISWWVSCGSLFLIYGTVSWTDACASGEGTYFYRADAAIYGVLALSEALRRSRLIDFKEAYHGT